MISDGDCVAVFHSVHRVMKAEKLLKAAGLEILLIPVPRQLSADCGLVIRFSYQDRSRIEDCLAKAELSIVEIWQKQERDFSRLL